MLLTRYCRLALVKIGLNNAQKSIPLIKGIIKEAKKMSLTLFSLSGLLLLGFYVLYKSITLKKAMCNYAKTLLKIKELEGFNPDFVDFLYSVNQQSVSNLFLPKIFLINFLLKKQVKKQAVESLKKFSQKELDIYIEICIESVKNYLYYAPHWAGIMALVGVIIMPLVALFSSLDKLTHFFMKSIELNLIKH